MTNRLSPGSTGGSSNGCGVTATGWTVTAQGLTKWLHLVPVLFLEIASAFGLLVASAVIATDTKQAELQTQVEQVANDRYQHRVLIKLRSAHRAEEIGKAINRAPVDDDHIEHVGVPLEPVAERYGGPGIRRQWGPAPPLLDSPIPRTNVLADVASVNHVPELRPIRLRYRRRSLRPIRKALRGVERPRLVQCPRRARLDAQAALSAVELERRRRLELDVRDHHAEHDP